SDGGRDGGCGRPGGRLWVGLRFFGLLRLQKQFRAPGGSGESLSAWIRSLGLDAASAESPSGGGVGMLGRTLSAWTRLSRDVGGWMGRHLTVHRLVIRLALGSGDAAATGWLTGAVWGFYPLL